ncbi:Ger(x)C family spore germination protein [Desulfosporosinus sp. OT]|uniref:Ger(x)C family spore germination protein n=1 Tax=Desulfosporosinus sp. OT TaxID=913865 RepID=UPI0002239B4E|nr:Ger(x)C family spore germination protein [Desulfosporosinus sp. OT]EGW39525.1 germination, Ger(x)C family protein [Desulfosporosinus sp. OT]
MRKLALILVCISLLTTGCWDYQEVDRLATVLALGIDRIPGSKNVLLTVQIGKPEGKGSSKQIGGQGGEKSYIIMNSEGKSLSEAILSIGKQSTRRVVLSHCKTAVLGRDLAEMGIGEILDDLKRARESRRTNWILTTDKTAKEIIEKDISLEQLPGRGLDHILQNFKKAGRVVPMNFNDFFARLNGESHVSFTPLAQLEDIDKQVTNQLEKVVGRSLDTEEKPKTLTIGKTAVFKNLRMVGVLNEDDTRAHKWLVDSPKGSSITLAYAPQAQTNGDKGDIMFEIEDGQTTITPHISEEGITMNIECTTKVLIHELGATGVNVLDPKVVAQLELQTAEAMKLQLEHTINTAQKELKSDCVGFAENLHNYYPLEWKQIKDNWDDVFPTVDYQIFCKVKILSSGTISNPTLRSEPE